MLCQFSFQNFKSYKDETTFDFRAMAIPEFQDALIRQEKAEDLLPVSAVYGPNGGGKTNLLQAYPQGKREDRRGVLRATPSDSREDSFALQYHG